MFHLKNASFSILSLKKILNKVIFRMLLYLPQCVCVSMHRNDDKSHLKTVNK